MSHGEMKVCSQIRSKDGMRSKDDLIQRTCLIGA